MALIIILASFLVIFAILLPDGNILRVIFGLPFLLFLPGYSLVSVLWPKKTEIDELERIALGFGLSIGIVTLTGLGLNYAPWGITLTSIVICLYSIIIIMVVLAWFRRSKLDPQERFTLNLVFFLNNPDTLSSTDKVLVVIIALAIVIGMGMLMFISMNPPKESYTELYILDENMTTANYPSILDLNDNASIVIVVTCHENQRTDYTTAVKLQYGTGYNTTLEEFSFSLMDNEKWSQVLNFSVNQTGTYKLVVELYKGTDSIPYVSNHLWIDVRN